MVRILYSVCGVGLGHASRSSVIIKELLKSHEVKIVSYSEGLSFLKKLFPEVHELKWFKYRFKKHRINKLLTLFFVILSLPSVLFFNYRKLNKLIKDFSPQLIISDFDFNALEAGKLKKIPVILVSNMHLLEYLKPEMNFMERIEAMLSDERMLKAYTNADYYLITSFFKPKQKESNRFFFHPIINPDLFKEKISDKGFFLVYMSPHCLNEFLPLLKEFPEKKFIVYGSDKRKKIKNIQFKPFSRKEWVKDINSCRAVLCHGGMLTLSEAVVLKKPCFVFASKDWLERFHNGFMIAKQGFGILSDNPSTEKLKEFFSSLPKFKIALKKKNISPENEKFLHKLNELINSLVSG